MSSDIDPDIIYSTLVIAECDLSDARDIANEILRLEYFNTGGLNLAHKVWTIALITTYIKPFIEIRGFKKRYKLGYLLKALSKKERKLHNYIYDLRNQVIAHSDKEFFSSVFNIADQKSYAGRKEPLVYLFGLEKAELQLLINIISKLEVEIIKERESLVTQLFNN